MKAMIAALAALTAAAASAQDIGGSYAVQGTGFNGSPYGGRATITRTSDVTCEIVWNTGGQTSEGICMRSGNVFAAAYVLEGRTGMVIYDIAPNGVLSGTWTVAGSNGVGTEILTPN